MRISNFLNLSYWFSLRPPFMSSQSLLMAQVAILVIFSAGIALKFYARSLRKDPPRARFVRRLGSPVIVFAVVLTIWLFMKYETIYLLGARFWPPMFTLIFGVWAWRLFDRFRRTAPQDNEAMRKAAEFRKYLPK